MAVTLHFLGAAKTVTGSQYLLDTGTAKVLIDCGMFQGTPEERIRNQVPFAYEPGELDAMLLTHAHLDHCGQIPRLVKAGFHGPIYATAGTTELAALVLLDSGKLQQEFAKRETRWERRHPDKAAQEDKDQLADYQAALELAEAGDALRDSPAIGAPGSEATGEHVPTQIEPEETYRGATGATDVAEVSPSGGLTSAAADEPAIDLDEPLYVEADARQAMTAFKPLRYNQELEVAPGVHATFVDAGHILGSAIILVRVTHDGGETTIVFSGDLGRPGSPILRDYTAVTKADYVLVETTYGGREHQPEAEAVDVLAQTIRMVADAQGVLLIPSFAIGRTQDIVYELDRLIDEGKIPLLPLYLDSPMGSKATDIYRRHTEYYDQEADAVQRAGETPLDYPKQIVTNKVEDSQAIARAQRPYMIVASNGMLTGGRVVNHLRNLIGDPNATLLFVGYQGVGTLGASLQAGAKTARVDGETVQVRCQIKSISGFSAHADESQILDWLRNFGANGVKRVFMVHGEPDAQTAIEPKIEALGLPTHSPQWHEKVTLD
jgi:Cft2 family RNA processing exonuclease